MFTWNRLVKTAIRKTYLVKKKALVMGLGVSGSAASEFLLSLGYEVLGVDRRKQDLKGLDIAFFREGEISFLKGISLVILSPGIPLTHPLVLLARSEGVEVIGEVELALRHMKQSGRLDQSI